jgi:dienelactone hydrolase
MRDGLLQIANIPVWWCDVAILLMYGPALAALWSGQHSWPRWSRIALLLGNIGVGLQFTVEGARWQLIPAVILTCELLVLCGVRSFYTTAIPAAYGGLGLIGVCAGIACYGMFPTFALLKPSGAYRVGTVVMHLVDRSRRETLGSKGNDYRELMVQLWYPADSGDSESGRRFPFWGEKGHITLNAEVSGARRSYPVVIFSPSWHGQRYQNSFQVEELASHEFVVVGIDHPYSSAVTLFPDGRVAHTQPVQFLDLSSDRALEASKRYNDKVLRVRVADVQFVVTKLKQLNRNGSGSRFSGRLDLSRLGIFGYSFGGAVAAQTCWQDQRFKAGIDMDGTLFGEVADAGVSQPFMFMGEGVKPPSRAEFEAAKPEKRRFARLVERDIEVERNSMEKHGGYWLAISGTRHVNFTDPPAFPTLDYYLREAGAINPMRSIRIVNAYTLAFFEEYLNEVPQPLLDGQSPGYWEVEFIWPPDTKKAS